MSGRRSGHGTDPGLRSAPRRWWRRRIRRLEDRTIGALLADARSRLARAADALADGEYELAFQIVEGLEHELARRRFE